MFVNARVFDTFMCVNACVFDTFMCEYATGDLKQKRGYVCQSANKITFQLIWQEKLERHITIEIKDKLNMENRK